MALDKCPECGERVSTNAWSCPHCGYEGLRLHFKDREYQRRKYERLTKPWTKESRHGCLGFLIVSIIIIIAIILWWRSG